MDVLACYGSGLHKLADTVGEVDPVAPEGIRAWKLDRWRETADAFDFREQVEPALQAAVESNEQLGSIDNVATAAWASRMAKFRYELPRDFPHKEVNQLRASIMGEVRTLPGSMWTVSADAVNLPGRACVGERRVFPSSNAPNYYDAGTSEEPTSRTCIWKSPVTLYLGTWPWFHGSNLSKYPPGLQWRDFGPSQPARQAIRVYSSAWTLDGNASIDAREVYAQFDHFRRQTDPLLAGLPSKPATVGALYIADGGYLRTYLTDARGRYLNGPLGPVSVAAYNHVLRSCAAFFALRRAILLKISKMPDSVKNRLKANPDPCASKHVKSKVVADLKGEG